MKSIILKSSLVRSGALAVVVALVAIGGLAGSASATSVDGGSGSGFSVRPDTLSGWTYGFHEVLGGRSNNPPVGYNPGGSFGQIKWVRWRKGFAIGVGTLWENSCSPSCGSGRWTRGGRIKVRLYKARNGHFKRMRFSRINGPRNTAIFAYRSEMPPQWKIIKRFRSAPSLDASTASSAGARVSVLQGQTADLLPRSNTCRRPRPQPPFYGVLQTRRVSCVKGRAVARSYVIGGCESGCSTLGFKCVEKRIGYESYRVRCFRGQQLIRFNFGF